MTSAQPHKPVKSKTFTSPFPHYQVSDFLSPALYAKTFQIYNKLQFKQKKSDLFKFFQTDQLNQYNKLQFFRQELDKQFWSLAPMNEGGIKKQDTFYSVFASYYFAGNYLLCHDDIVEDRKYAFSYYLEDHPSGDLVLYNSTADKEAKRIKVKKNTLVIFEVSNISYHEVDYTQTDGRKAITGWFNIRGLGSQRQEKQIAPYAPTLPASDSTIPCPLPSHYYSQEYFQLIDISYQFDIKKNTLQGPFFQRKVHKIELDQTVVFELPGFKLYSAQLYNFKQGDYLLLNDPINTLGAQFEGREVIDLFVTHLPEGFVKDESQEDEDEEGESDMLVKIAQPDEETAGIPQVHDSLFVVRRGKKQYYVDRCEKEFMLGHFVYVEEEKAEEKSKAKKEKVKETKVIVPGQIGKQKKEGKKDTKTGKGDSKNKNESGAQEKSTDPAKTKRIAKQK